MKYYNICNIALTDRFPVGHLSVGQLSPSGMMVEMADDDWNVGVPRLTDRLPIVEALDDTHQSHVLLKMSRNASHLKQKQMCHFIMVMINILYIH